MISFDRFGFIIFCILIVVFFIIPDPETLQKPFRISIALLFGIIFISMIIYQQINIKLLIPIAVSGLLIWIMISRGTLQSSFINAWLCLWGLFIFPKLTFRLNEKRIFDLNTIHFLCMTSFILQFIYFSSSANRPSLGYEINLSGAYLFLFFLFSDLLERKDGKILVIALSLLLLSRLLIFSILLFYIIRYTKRYFSFKMEKIRFSIIAIVSYIMISLFSVWYIATIKSKVSYETGISRIIHLDDGSNMWRFLTNTLVMAKIYTTPSDPNILFGYGPVENFLSSTKGSWIMPHNELYDAIVEFGLISVIFFSFFTFSVFNNYTSFKNWEYIIPLLFYTLILWVRFIIVPSFEMIFILFMLNIMNERSKQLEKEQPFKINRLSYS
jgi:hypothetical protein